jgi:hypothetical protein
MVMMELTKMEYYKTYGGYTVAKYSVEGVWVYVVWMDKDRMYQCDSYAEAKEWIDAR